MQKCPLCNNAPLSGKWAEENGYEIKSCGSCGSLFISPMPLEDERKEALLLGLHRGENLLDTGKKPDPARIPIYLETLKEFYPDSSCMNGKKWLDIGAGNGEWIAALKLYFPGIACSALEPNLKKRTSPYFSGCRLYENLEALDTAGPFHVISLLNVWSHLTDPLNFMNDVSMKLHAEGQLLIQTGNAADIKRYEFPGKLMLPDHVSFASPTIIGNLMAKLHFNQQRFIKYRHPRKRSAIFFIKLGVKVLLGKQAYPYGYIGGRFRDCWMLFGKMQK